MSDSANAPIDENHPDFAASRDLLEKLSNLVSHSVDQGLSHERILAVFEGMVEEIKAEAEVINMDWKFS